MRSITFLVLIPLVAAGLLVTQFQAHANGNTIYVDDDGGADYTSIQDAIDAANPGDTIYVYNGTYPEQIDVDKSLKIQGESNTSTVVEGGFSIQQDKVAIENFKIMGGYEFSDYDKAGIYAASNCNIFTNNDISNIIGGQGTDSEEHPEGGIGTGIYLFSANQNIINANTISLVKGGSPGDHPYWNYGGRGSGIYLEYSNNNTAVENTISSISGGNPGAWRYGPASGIRTEHSNVNKINSNEISSLISMSCLGIDLSDSSGNIIDSNIISTITGKAGKYGYTGQHGGTVRGIAIGSSTENTISSNEITQLTGGNGGKGDVIAGNGGWAYGIYLSSSAGNIVNGNKISSLTGGNGNRTYGSCQQGGGGGAISICFYYSDNNEVNLNNISLLVGGTGVCATGGLAGGMYLFDSDANILNCNALTMIQGGEGGDGLRSWSSENGRPGGRAVGIYQIQSNNNISSSNNISEITGGDGGDDYYTIEGADGGHGGVAQGIRLEIADYGTINGNIISEVTGGMGGHGRGQGGTGGHAEGIQFVDSDSSTALLNDVSTVAGGTGGGGNPGPDGDGYGLLADADSSNNEIYRNNCYTNDENANDDGTSNAWDSGSEGNYWDDYTGSDGNGDGIGDTPYTIPGSAGAQDNYPLMSQIPVFASGKGTEVDPYQIANVYQLQNVNLELDAHYILTNDIDASYTSSWNSGSGFMPIGYDPPYFTGSLDGNGFSINNLTINRPDLAFYTGLFGNIELGGTVQDMTLNDFNITGNQDVGGLAGKNSGSLTGCIAKGTVSGSKNVGGLVGNNWGPVSECYTEGTVASSQIAGGLLGFSFADVTNCYSISKASGSTGRAGGLIGQLGGGLVQYCYAAGPVSGGTDTGGVVGFGGGNVFYSYWDKETTGQTNDAVLPVEHGKTTAEMKTLDPPHTYQGWDFDLTWSILAHVTYPYFRSELSSAFAGGNGTEADPYQIANVDQLQNMDQDPAADYVIINDINASPTYCWNEWAGFEPVGNGTNHFTGNLDGNGFTISNLFMNLPSEDYVGLFGIRENGEIHNVNLENASITGYNRVGGIVGFNWGLSSGTISNCSVTGTVSGNNDIGGLAGEVASNSGIVRCFVSGNVTGERRIGGLVGNANIKISDCYARGEVNGYATVGGLIGLNFKDVESSYAACGVSADQDVGGLICICPSGLVIDSFWDTETSGQAGSDGGTGKTNAEMKDVATFTDTTTEGLDSPWDFENDPNDDTGTEDYWSISSNYNNGYPFLAWEEHVIYVDASAIGDNDGSSWANAFNSLQDAIDEVAEIGASYEIWVAAGTYTPSSTYGGTSSQHQCFQMKDGAYIYGGFPDTGTPTWEDRDWETYHTILSGEIGEPGTATDNCFHVVRGADHIGLDGVIVEKGYANGISEPDFDGGGMYNELNLTDVQLENCTFRWNTASSQGGAIKNYDVTDISATNCLFYKNSANSNGAIKNRNTEMDFYYCTFAENSDTVRGGAIMYWGGLSGSPEIRNCTFFKNASASGGAIHCRAAEINAQVKNCLFAENTPDDIGLTHSASAYVSYSRITQSGYAGSNNNIADDPVFAGTMAGQIALYDKSPCIDAGDPASPNDPDGTRANMGDCHPVIPTRFYVDSDAIGDNDGLSWTDAFNDLQYGIDEVINSGTFCEIWVAAGTYTPISTYGGTSSQHQCFQMKDGAYIYGGFPSTGTPVWEDRDWETYETILSGEIGDPGTATDNCFHVLRGADHIGLDGVIVEKGYANAPAEPDSDGAGMYNKLDLTDIQLENCTFRWNNASFQGGAIYNYEVTDITATNCLFYQNQASGNGCVKNRNTEMDFCYCTFIENADTSRGGAIMYWGGLSGSPEIRNCTFFKNASASGGAIHCRAAGINARIKNCLFAENTPDDIGLTNGATAYVSYSRITQSGYAGINNNIAANPMFAGTVNGRVVLYDQSPCIDAGDPASPLDPDGSRANMGDFHPVVPTRVYVDADAAGNNDGSSWADAFNELQDGIDEVANIGTPCEVWVAVGTYVATTEVGGTGNRYKTFQLKNGAEVYGGFPNTGTPAWKDRDWELNETILSGEIGDSGTKTDNCYHVFYHLVGDEIDGTAVLDGFTITGGYADGSGDHDDGGGMFNDRCSPTIANCDFVDNYAMTYGGGLYNYDASPTLTSCTFFSNQAKYHCGGLYNDWYSTPVVTNCTFTGNHGGWDGGGIENRRFSDAVITNCTFWNNQADFGGGIYTEQSSPLITNCILWEDIADLSGNEIYISSGTPVITYCDIQGDHPGTGCFSGTPMWTNPGSGDFHLLSNSPCIDTGTNSAPNLPERDFEGENRIIGETVDIGADEFCYYELVISSGTGGSVTVPGEGFHYYQCGTVVAITAEASPCYEFLNWMGSGTPAIANPGSPNTTISIDNAYAIQANFHLVCPMVGIYVGLQGDNRPPEGWQVPIDVGFYPPGSPDTWLLNPASAIYYFSGTTTAVSTAGGTRAYFQCPDPVNSGTYDVTADSNTTLMNVKKGVELW